MLLDIVGPSPLHLLGQSYRKPHAAVALTADAVSCRPLLTVVVMEVVMGLMRVLWPAIFAVVAAEAAECGGT